jgi:hypothetical protein
MSLCHQHCLKLNYNGKCALENVFIVHAENLVRKGGGTQHACIMTEKEHIIEYAERA